MTAPAPSVLARGAMFGRYIILSLLGRGGMGEVYSAYDPRLDRKVALKLLHETAPGGAARIAQERLLREAQSAARLSHRNVVVVYDTGVIEDQTGATRVYLAMELVEGRTLAAWLSEKRSPWREIRDVFLAAAEGLAAAHEAGLVHRDFKPQNVMVGADGTARVLDFGLAADGSELADGSGSALDLKSSDTVTAQTIALSHTGVLLGTPVYMAPEQFLGRKTDARADQFSFCVSLYEALYGERPFASGSLAELIGAVVGGRVRESPRRNTVPPFLRPILLRGLSADPASRFASMRELMSALRVDPLRRRRTLAFGAGAAVLLVVAAAGAQRAATRGQRLCRGAPAKLQGIWEADEAGPRREALHRAFLATGSGIAGETWTRVSALLDDYARRWTTAYTDTCEATHVRGDQSPEVMDLRMTCLDRDRTALRALSDVFSTADARAVIGAVDAVRALPAIDECNDLAALRAVVPPPADPATRARLGELSAQLAEAKALIGTGQWPAADKKVRSLIDAARALGYQPLLAEALAARGWVAGQMEDLAASTAAYGEAVNVALLAHRDDLSAEAAAQMVGLTVDAGDLEATNYWEMLAGALIDRLGPGHERIAAWFQQNRAGACARRGDLNAAMVALNLALALKRKILPPADPDIAISLSDLSYGLVLTGRAEQALVPARQSIEIYRHAYGNGSPTQSLFLVNRGVALRAVGRFREAEADFRTSRTMAESWLGANNRWTAAPLTELGKTLIEEGKYRDAAPLLESAIRIRGGGDPGSPELADARFALAQAHWAIGQDRAGARVLAGAALAAYRALPGYKDRADKIAQWLSDKLPR